MRKKPQALNSNYFLYSPIRRNFLILFIFINYDKHVCYNHKNFLLLMGNLFGSFDPRTGAYTRINWASVLVVAFIPNMYWLLKNKSCIIIRQGANSLRKEVGLVNYKGFKRSISLIMVSILCFIILNNFIGLLPYVFTASSHLSFTMPLAFSVWAGFVLTSFLKNTREFLAHLVPIGTPSALVPFIVVIEIISAFMRPLTLAVRLAANMIAGHLLLILVSLNIPKIGFLRAFLAFGGLMLLIVLEVAVSFIQGYVFIRLSSLYLREVNKANM